MGVSTINERTRLIEDEERHRDVSHTISNASTAADVNATTPIKWGPLIILLVFYMMQPLAFEVVFPFVNQMILEVGVVTDPERVGYYSGFIESIYSCMSFVAILPCSALSDRIGRKPVILGGMLGLAVSVVSFSMSKSFAAMVLSRSIGGTLGAASACVRTMIGEMSDRSNQGLAFTASAVAHRMGQIIGLPLGGLLAHPERNFSLFKTPFWYEYPFALPCFVAAVLCISSVAMGYFLLKETLGSTGKQMPTEETTYSETVRQEDQTFKHKYKSVMTPPILAVLLSNTAMCFASETLVAVLPLFLFTPVTSGGLEMTEAAIGTHMGTRSAMSVVLMAFFSPLQKRFGTVRVYQLAMWTWPLTILGFPLLHLLVQQPGMEGWPLIVGLSIFFSIWSIGGFAWTASSIMVNDVVPSAAALATINGLQQMAFILPQAVAPAFVTSLFAASIKSGIAGNNLIWIVLFIMAIAAAVHSMTLREPDTDWRQENL